ncbi:CPBP family intramembrane metalloprotease [Marilutibacter aestuarii]
MPGASLPPPLAPRAAAVPRPMAPLPGFFVDLGMAIGLLVALSTLFSIAAAVIEGATALSRGEPLAPDGLLHALAQPDALVMIWVTLLATGGSALIVYALRGRATPDERRRSRQALSRPSTWGWMALVGLATLAASTAIAWLGRQLGSEPVPTNQAMIQAAFEQSPLFMYAFAVLLAPAYEELLFRRVLFGRLWRAGRPWLGMVLSSAAFALIHELPGVSANSWPATVQLWLTYGFMGAAFAWVYRRTGSLGTAIGAHALNNAVACLLLVLGYA